MKVKRIFSFRKLFVTAWKSLFLWVILTTMSFTAVQAKDAKATLKEYFAEVRKGRSVTLPAGIFQPANEKVILQTSVGYLSDSVDAVRSAAIYVIKSAGLMSKKADYRQQCVLYLLQACSDKNSGNSGQASNYLTQFNPSDFNPSARDSLRKLLQANTPHIANIIKLAGFVQLTDMISYISDAIYVQPPKWKKKDAWAAHLALARMGVEDEIDYCLNRVKKIPLNDDVVYNLLPDLIYIRQKPVYDYLVSLLYIDEKLCNPADPDAETKILCGYRIMEMLATEIKNFPLPVQPSGDIDTDDYHKALMTLRQWFNDNPDYQIITDRF